MGRVARSGGQVDKATSDITSVSLLASQSIKALL